MQLEPGDRLLFYSDGITEAAGPDGDMLGGEGFARMLNDVRDQPLAESLTTCVNELQRWSESGGFADDVSLLALEIPRLEDQ